MQRSIMCPECGAKGVVRFASEQDLDRGRITCRHCGNAFRLRSSSSQNTPRPDIDVGGPAEHDVRSLYDVAWTRGFPGLNLTPEEQGDSAVVVSSGERAWLVFCANSRPDWLDKAKEALAEIPPSRPGEPPTEDLVWNIAQAKDALARRGPSLHTVDYEVVKAYWTNVDGRWQPHPVCESGSLENTVQVVVEKLQAEARLMRRELSDILSIEHAAQDHSEPDGLSVILWRRFRGGDVDGVPHFLAQTGPDKYVFCTKAIE